MGADTLPTTDHPEVTVKPRLKRLGVVVALPEEARTLLGRRAPIGAVVELESNADLLVAVCGLGARRAADAAGKLADAGVANLLSWGTAGGLDPGLAAGVLVLPTEVLDETGRRHAVDAAWHARLICELASVAALIAGRMLSVPQPLTSATAKQAAHRASGACAVDMESAAIAGIAVARGLPFAVVRVVVDPPAFSFPRAVQVALDEAGHLQAAALGRALLRHPREISGMLRLAGDFRKARRSLRLIARQGQAAAFWAPVPEAPADQADPPTVDSGIAAS